MNYPPPSLTDAEQKIVDDFHRLYYDKKACWRELTFMGTRTIKYPTDLLVYADLLWKCKPTRVIETGTHAGGSALFLATIMDAIAQTDSVYHRNAQILTIDIEYKARPVHPRITYLTGSSLDEAHLAYMREQTRHHATLVILDSDHSQHHVLREMLAYAPLVTSSSYLIVEDTNVNGHPVFPDHGAGPMEAVREFLSLEPGSDFTIDTHCERFLLTANPNGFLRKT